MLNACGVEYELDFRLLGAAGNHGVQVFEHCRKVDAVFGQIHLAAFDVAHVEHVVDEVEQMATGNAHLI